MVIGRGDCEIGVPCYPQRQGRFLVSESWQGGHWGHERVRDEELNERGSGPDRWSVEMSNSVTASPSEVNQIYVCMI